MSVIALVLAAAAWDSTFDATATSSYLDRPNAAVLVVSAGETSASGQAATTAIVQALRASKRTRLVMTGESVNVQPTDTDATIVKRASVLPIDLVLVVRLFPGATETVVATLYDKTGAAVSAMAGTEGRPLALKERQLASTAGRDAVVSSVEKSKRGSDEGDSPIETAFESADEHITFKKRDPETAIYKRQPLEGARFYEVVGEPALASQLSSRVAVKAVTISAGIAGVLLGTGILLFGSQGCAVLDRATFTCVRYRGVAQPLSTGLIVAGAGLASLIFGIAFPSDPVSREKRRELVNRHNQALDDKLREEPKAQRPAITDVQLAVVPVAQGVLGALSFSF